MLECTIEEPLQSAEKLTASLDAITGQEQVKIVAQERIATIRPAPHFHHQGWSIGASVSIGKDGKINPGFTPSFTEDGRRISATISEDLFTGFEAIIDKLTETFREIDTKDGMPIDSKPGAEQSNPSGPKTTSSEAQKEAIIETQKKELTVLATKTASDIIDKSSELKPAQKAKLKEALNRDISLLVKGDSATRDKYYKLQAYIKNQQAHNEKTFGTKVLDALDTINPLNLIFGGRQSHASTIPVDPALVASIAPLIGGIAITVLAEVLTPLAVIALGVYSMNQALSSPETQARLDKLLNPDGNALANDVTDKSGSKPLTKPMPDVLGTPDGPDFDSNEHLRKTNPEKAESEVWNGLKPYRGRIRTNGLRGISKDFTNGIERIRILRCTMVMADI